MSLSEKETRLAQLAVTFVDADWERLRELRRNAPEGEPDRAWRETVLQAQLFCGFPRAISGYGVLQEEGGLGELEEGEFRGEPDQFDRGAELFARIYGEGTDRVQGQLAGFHPDLAQWIQGHVYGRVLARPGLTARMRELLAVVSLAALGHERQLASHARGAIACGATREDVDAALHAVRDQIQDERFEVAVRVVERFAR